ncbi:MAG: S41 family peptidase [Pseudomonadota bacterium]
MRRAILASTLLLGGGLMATPLATAATPSPTRQPLVQDGRVVEPAQGVWRNDDYGWILRIDGDGITRWQDTPAGCYATTQDGPTLMAQVEYRYVTVLDDGRARFEYLPSDGHTVFERLPSLPAHCGAKDLSGPVAVFDTFVAIFSRHYAFFERRGIDWPAAVAAARTGVHDGMGQAELWDVLAGLIRPLGDSHTKLIGSVDGEPRREQAGLGATLPAVRAGMGEPAWLKALVAGTLSRLDGGGHHVGNERVVWGSLDGDIGYLQVFTMGGFTTAETPGTPEWAAAEIAAIHALMDEILAAFKGHRVVILDLSNNRGGYDAVTRAIVSHFIDQPQDLYTVRNHWDGAPAATYRVQPWSGQRFGGPVYVLTSDVTVSGGEITTLMLRQLPQVVHVGRTTRGSFSTPLAKPLPNGWYVELSNEIFADMEGQVYEGRGLSPDWDLQVFAPEDPVGSHARALDAIIGRIREGDPH